MYTFSDESLVNIFYSMNKAVQKCMCLLVLVTRVYFNYLKLHTSNYTVIYFLFDKNRESKLELYIIKLLLFFTMYNIHLL